MPVPEKGRESGPWSETGGPRGYQCGPAPTRRFEIQPFVATTLDAMALRRSLKHEMVLIVQTFTNFLAPFSFAGRLAKELKSRRRVTYHVQAFCCCAGLATDTGYLLPASASGM